jgi:hypothetical protein
MKEYTIYQAKKARNNLGICVACSKAINKGEAYKYAEDQTNGKYIKILFCTNCKVDQSKIGKNVQNGKVREILETRTKGQTKSIASFITEEKSEVSKHQPSAEEIEEEKMSEDSDILAKSCLEIPKAYCSKCRRNHVVGSRRYERHIHFIKK